MIVADMIMWDNISALSPRAGRNDATTRANNGHFQFNTEKENQFQKVKFSMDLKCENAPINATISLFSEVFCKY